MLWISIERSILSRLTKSFFDYPHNFNGHLKSSNVLVKPILRLFYSRYFESNINNFCWLMWPAPVTPPARAFKHLQGQNFKHFRGNSQGTHLSFLLCCLLWRLHCLQSRETHHLFADMTSVVVWPPQDALWTERVLSSTGTRLDRPGETLAATLNICPFQNWSHCFHPWRCSSCLISGQNVCTCIIQIQIFGHLGTADTRTIHTISQESIQSGRTLL